MRRCLHVPDGTCTFGPGGTVPTHRSRDIGGAMSTTRGMERMKLRQVGAVFAAASIVLAACGDDDDNASDTTTAQTTQAPATTAGSATTEAPATTAASSATTNAPATTAATSSTEESSSSVSGSATQPAGGQMIIKPGECGMNTGQAATGDAIKLGGLATNIPGVDFT